MAEGQTNQTELNQNGSAQNASPKKDCSDKPENLTPANTQSTTLIIWNTVIDQLGCQSRSVHLCPPS